MPIMAATLETIQYIPLLFSVLCNCVVQSQANPDAIRAISGKGFEDSIIHLARLLYGVQIMTMKSISGMHELTSGMCCQTYFGLL